jgi:leucyl-tRNA synthetase
MHPTDIEFTGQGGNPLTQSESFINTTDSQGRPARRETDTMDTSSIRAGISAFLLARRSDVPFSNRRHRALDGGRSICRRRRTRDDAPDLRALFHQSVGGLGILRRNSGTVSALFTQGMVTMVSPASGKPEKMSKSKGNVVSLDDSVEKFGADATRMMTLFFRPACARRRMDAAIRRHLCRHYRFLERVWRVSTVLPFEPNWRDGLGGELSEADRNCAAKRIKRFKKSA